MITLTDVPYTTIPLFYQGGNIVAMRVSSANTTAELRTKDFALVVAPGLDGKASGSLYLDDGESLVQQATSYIHFYYDNNRFSMTGTFDYDAGVSITSITILGGSGSGTSLMSSGLNIPLHQPYAAQCGGSGWRYGAHGQYGPPGQYGAYGYHGAYGNHGPRSSSS